MSNTTQVGVIGSAIFAPRYPERASLEEAQHAAAQAALRDAGLTIDDIDGIVVAGCDQLDGRAISIMMASGSVGGVGRDILSTPSSAEHAFVLGTLRVRSGMYRTHLVMAWSPLETDDISNTQRLGTDPYFHRSLPLDELSSHALQANALEAKVPDLRAAAIAVVEQNRRNGARAHPDYSPAPQQASMIEGSRMLRWPINEGMVAPPAYGIVAMVLADAEYVAEKSIANPAWVTGMGWATEPGFLGDRDLSTLPSLQSATAQAYREAGVAEGAPSFDIAEVADATPYQQLVALEGLGLCARTEWSQAVKAGDFAAGGKLPVNLSGGALCFNAGFCAGLIRICEAARQVRGTAGPHQKADVRTAVAHGASGFAMQYNTVVVFGRDPQEPKK